MSVEQSTGTDYRGDFVVRPDGSVAGDDGASGALAAAMPYAGRLARRMGELVDAGDLRMVQAFGARLLTIGVTWTPAGEGTFRATTTPLEPRTAPELVVVDGADTSAAVAHCVSRLLWLEGIVWKPRSSRPTPASSPLRGSGWTSSTSRRSATGCLRSCGRWRTSTPTAS